MPGAGIYTFGKHLRWSGDLTLRNDGDVEDAIVSIEIASAIVAPAEEDLPRRRRRIPSPCRSRSR
jgi:hypothetical protein